MTNALGIEEARILTISTAHLHPDTISALEVCRGDLNEGPSVAVRDEGYLMNSHLEDEDALAQDFTAGLWAPLAERHPDLVLIRALARGMGAAWVNIDRDGVEYSDILPSYADHQVTLPTREGWRDALASIAMNYNGHRIVMPDRQALEIIEAGQTPGLSDDPQP